MGKEAEELQQQTSGEEEQRLKTDVGGQEKPQIEDDEDVQAAQDEQKELSQADSDEEREAIRARRREERQSRKEHRRQKEEESRRLISSLQRQNSELAGRLAVVERRNAGADVAQLDYAIQEAQGYAEEAKRRLDAAITANDGKAAAEANEVYYAARRRVEDLGAYKSRLTAARPERPTLDPQMVSSARSWMMRNKWYDPSGGDQDSKVVLSLDQGLSEEQLYDPRTPEYWQELDSRVKKYLPHRSKGGYNNGERREAAAPSGPKIAGSGRDGGGSGGLEAGGFRLSKERVDALKEAGLWEDPQARAKAIERYKQYDKEHG